MLNQKQVKEYYYIDRKLISNNYTEVVEGLGELRAFLVDLEVDEILNSLMMRLIDLYKTSKISYLRIKSSQLLVEHGHKLPRLPSKEEIINNLSKCIKNKDEFTSTLTLETISKLPLLFEKENSVYHMLLGKVNAPSTKQRLRAIQCLCSLLGESSYLSQLFSRNLEELSTIGGISIKILLFVSQHAKFEIQQLPSIMLTLWCLAKDKLTKLTKHYLHKLIAMFSLKNYKVISIYQEHISATMPSLFHQLETLKLIYYPFLHTRESAASLSHTQLLDLCYLTPYSQIQHLSAACEDRIIQSINERTLTSQIALLAYYTTTDYDKQFHALLTATQKQRKKWLKMFLVIGGWRCASAIIEQLLNCYTKCNSGLIVMKLYADYQLQPSQERLLALCQVGINICTLSHEQNLLYLFRKWKQQSPPKPTQGSIGCGEEMDWLEGIRHDRYRPLRLKTDVYLSKQTVIKVLDKL